MGPPPATPAPSRFLTSKRPGTQQSQSQTPNQQTSNGPHQFRATPRFTSTPRPFSSQPGPAFATLALATKPRASRTRSTQDVIDDRSPVSPDEDSLPSPLGLSTTRSTLPEPIEFDSSLVLQSPSSEELNEGRSLKRRRISVASSDDAIDPLPSSQHQDAAAYGSDHVEDDGDDLQMNDDTDISPIRPTASPSLSIKAEEESELEGLDAEAHDSKSEGAKPALNKPAFRSAPRFKLTEPPDKFHARPDAYLTDIFSPQRRGAKYLAGGIAAELRDWLVDVKGGVDGEGEVRATSSALKFDNASATARVVVDEVSHGGPGMTLISGRSLDKGTGPEQGAGVKAILAGEGTIEGLGSGGGGGNRSRVGPGAVVAIAPPAWDVELDEYWAVAYRWEVVEAAGGDAGRWPGR